MKRTFTVEMPEAERDFLLKLAHRNDRSGGAELRCMIREKMALDRRRKIRPEPTMNEELA